MTFVKLEDAVKAVEALRQRIAAEGQTISHYDARRNVLKDIEKALRSLPTDDGWEDIATAPRQVWLLCWGPDAGCGVAKYPFNIIGDEWPDYTHWRPLPAPPSD